MADDGATALAAALARSAVETVEIGGNKIGDAGAKALRAAEADRAARPAPGLDVAMLDDRRPQIINTCVTELGSLHPGWLLHSRPQASLASGLLRVRRQSGQP